MEAKVGIIKAFNKKYGLKNAKEKLLEEMKELETELIKNEFEIDLVKVAVEAAHVVVTLEKFVAAYSIKDKVLEEIIETFKHLELLLQDEQKETERWEQRKRR